MFSGDEARARPPGWCALLADHGRGRISAMLSPRALLTKRALLFPALIAGLGVCGPAGVAAIGRAAQTPGTSTTSDLETRLAAVDRALDERRVTFGVPGAALVIVLNDRVIELKGFGLRDVKQQLAVTPDTLFEIGSTTKAFTSMAAIITADEGKIALDDPVRKYLPYFKLRDPEADANVTIRDLLTHRIGLKANDDDAWADHPERSREEVIKLTMVGKPTAKFREKYQYNNAMYSAAGECIAAAQQASWEDVVNTRILAPLGMRSSAPSLKMLHTRTDEAALSAGYQPGKAPKPIPLQDLSNIAPAGAIVSSARDMAQWLRVMLNGGVVDGRRIVSEAGFKELLTPQIRVNAEAEYGSRMGPGPVAGYAARHSHGWNRRLQRAGGPAAGSARRVRLPEQRAGPPVNQRGPGDRVGALARPALAAARSGRAGCDVQW